MNCCEFLNNVHEQIVEAFEEQKIELFGIAVFVIEGKKLYADKLRLSIISPTFKAMLSERWTSKDEPIKINGYKFEDFKEFISFLYSGKIELTFANIFDVLETAAFYQVLYLKQLCDEFLSKMNIDCGNILQLITVSNKYSLIHLKASLKTWITDTNFFGSDYFLNSNKSMIQDLMDLEVAPEQLFQAVYEWAEYQVTKKHKKLNEDEFNLNEAIKTEITEFLPYFRLNKIKESFLLKFFAKKNCIFSDEERRDLSDNFNSETKVKVTNSDGKSIIGVLSNDTDADIIKIIKSIQNRPSDNREGCCILWRTKSKIPSTPSPLKKREGVIYYFIYFPAGSFGVIHSIQVQPYDCYYLLAEIDFEIQDGFEHTTNSKIEII